MRREFFFFAILVLRIPLGLLLWWYDFSDLDCIEQADRFTDCFTEALHCPDHSAIRFW